MTTLYVLKGREFVVAEANDILRCAHELIAIHYRTGEPVLSDPPKTEAFLRLHLGLKEYEVFGLLHLTNGHRLIAMEDIFRGTVNACRIYPREVVKSVLRHNSVKVVLYHNHPSGDSEPSPGDEDVTDKLVAALRTIDVEVLDHLIVGRRVFSFRQARLLY